MHRSFSGLFALACFFFFGLTSTAHADTYAEFTAGTSSGNFVYYFNNGSLIGSYNGINNSTFALSYTGAITPLSSFPLPADNGSPCTPSDTSAYTGVSGAMCNNGYEAFSAYPKSGAGYFAGIYHGPDPATDELYPGGLGAGGIKIDSFGDIAFTEYFAGPHSDDLGVVFFDLTTHTAVTPEPGSILLSATALLLLFGLRSRFAHA